MAKASPLKLRVEVEGIPAAVMVPLDAVHPWEGNPRDNTEAVDAVAASIERFGFAAPIVARQEDGEIIAGHTRWLAAQRLGITEVPVRYLDLSLAEARALNLADNRVGEIAQWDEGKLMAAAAQLQAEGASLDGLGFEDWEIDAILPEPEGADPEYDDLFSDGADEEPFSVRPDTRQKLYMRDVPNTVWPTDNDWGIPLLNLDLCADAVDQPWTRWGQIGRYSTMKGTWHFYTDDDRFEPLWRNPTGVLNSGAVTVVEPNFTTTPTMPRAEALWSIYRKRWLARWWQSHGLRVIVDVNVAVIHQDLALLGVPSGWKAYATRFYAHPELERVADEVFDRCAERAGTRHGLLFVVYGGGKAVKALALKRGWIWLPDESDAVRSKGTASERS